MDASDLCYATAAQLSKLIKAKRVSPVEVLQAHLERIQATEPTLNSFITLTDEDAQAEAHQAEREVLAGHYRGPLHGVPVGLKDLFYVNGVRNTSGSKIHHDFVPSYDGTVAARFRQAGAILMGKLNMHPFAMGGTSENPDYGNVHNPWDPTRSPGGSSGGSGSAVAAGQCTVAMGTDTAGSVRIPASFCGLVGLKPTYGRISRYGLTALSWSLDHAGPLTRTVEDCALVMNVLAGHDPNDPTSASIPVPDYTASLHQGVKGLRIGVPKEYFELPIEERVKEAMYKALDVLQELGASVREVSWPMFRHGVVLVTVLAMAEAASTRREMIITRGDEIPPDLRSRLEMGLLIPAADYIKAQQIKRLFTEESHRLMEQVDLLAGPTASVVPIPIGTSAVTVGGVTMNLTTALARYTRPFNANGFPAITVPCGFSNEGLPIGLHLAGRPFEEGTLLRAAYAYEQATQWHQRKPPI